MVNGVSMDQEFDKVVNQMGIALVNSVSAREHVMDAEQNIQSIKKSGQ